MTIFARLLSSGLPVTWTTIRMAWQRNEITREELLAYAMDKIGYVSPEQDELVAELAFADGRHICPIQRCLEGLAPEDPQEMQNALRVWRWVLLNDIVTVYEKQAQAAPDKSAAIYSVWTDDFRSSVYCSLRDFWSEFEFPIQGFAVTQDWQKAGWFHDIPSTLRFIAEHRRWLTQEFAECRKMDEIQ